MALIQVVSSLALGAPIDPTDKEAFEILGVRLFKDTSEDVIKNLGPTEIIKRGKTDHDSEVRYCYVAKDGTELTFEQGFSYAYQNVSGYRLQKKGSGKNCAASDKFDAALKPAIGLGLNLTKAQVEKILGKPTARVKGRWEYHFEKYEAYDAAKAAEVNKKAKSGFKYKGQYHYLNIVVAFGPGQKTSSVKVDFSGEPDW